MKSFAPRNRSCIEAFFPAPFYFTCVPFTFPMAGWHDDVSSVWWGPGSAAGLYSRTAAVLARTTQKGPRGWVRGFYGSLLHAAFSGNACLVCPHSLVYSNAVCSGSGWVPRVAFIWILSVLWIYQHISLNFWPETHVSIHMIRLCPVYFWGKKIHVFMEVPQNSREAVGEAECHEHWFTWTTETTLS